MNSTRDIFRAFKSRGLTISVDVTRTLSTVLTDDENFHSSLDAILSEIKLRIEKREIRTSIIDAEIIKSIISDLSTNEDDLLESTQLINAYGSPKVEFDIRQKLYRVNAKPSYLLHGSAESRANMYRDRITFVQQRLLRSGQFSMRGINNNLNNNKHFQKRELSPISALLGGQGKHTLLGILTQPEEGVWYIEDVDGCLPLDLSQAQPYHFMITEGCIVLVEGSLTDGKLRVEALALPPPEDRGKSIEAIGTADIFGNNVRPSQLLPMHEHEKRSVDTMFVIISDLQLDRPNVCDNLRSVFEGFSDCANVHYILIGPFAGRAVLGGGHSGGDALEAALGVLGDIICSFPSIRDNNKFVLVPTSEDAGTGAVLPFRTIPTLFSADLQKRVPGLSLGTNPCRIRFYTQEIVLFKEDLVRKMQRFSISQAIGGSGNNSFEDQDAAEDRKPFKQLASCLLSQGHLFPLPPEARPVVWELDYTLRLFPLPTLLVLSTEHSEQSSSLIDNCQVINPGSFSADASFFIYYPADQRCEPSQLP